jgi:hypothetical protein
MSTSGRTFVRSALSKDKKHRIPVRISDMTAADALWWDRKIGPHHLSITGRADRFWEWSVLLPACTLIQKAKGRQCRALVVWAKADNQKFVRAGMSMFIQRYPYLDVRQPSDAEFIWFISGADPAVLASKFGISHPPSLARVFIDMGIVLSQNVGTEGRIGLHAALAGGESLLNVYSRCELEQLPATAPLPTGLRRPNDGRFFYADCATAERLARKLDPNR